MEQSINISDYQWQSFSKEGKVFIAPIHTFRETRFRIGANHQTFEAIGIEPNLTINGKYLELVCQSSDEDENGRTIWKDCIKGQEESDTRQIIRYKSKPVEQKETAEQAAERNLIDLAIEHGFTSCFDFDLVKLRTYSRSQIEYDIKTSIEQGILYWQKEQLTNNAGQSKEADRFSFLLKNKILVEVRPIDSWNEWTYQITGEDCLAPFCMLHQSSPETPYKTYHEAMADGITHAYCFLPDPPKQ